MAYVIAAPCVSNKDASCVAVCPVDAIHPTPSEPEFDTVTQLFIDPRECIDCDGCLTECPVQAIYPDHDLPAEWRDYAARNARYFSAPTFTGGEVR